MRNPTEWMVVAVVLAVCFGAPIAAQEPPADEQPATPAEEPPPAPAEQPPPPAPKKKLPFALYVSVSAGQVDGDPFNTSVVTRAGVDQTFSTFTLDNQLMGRASLGWKLPNDKGDFRLDYTGLAEDTYSVASSGQTIKTFREPGVSGQIATDLIEWWSVTAEGGSWVAVRTPRLWSDETDDANGNGQPDPDEVRRLPPDRVIRNQIPASLNNRLQAFDFVYGREFGGRRFSSRWWAGLRYFEYTGQLIAPAWLAAQNLPIGTGFTDDALLIPLLLAQETSGLGPTGAWEIHFNFFEKKLRLYLRAQTAFLLSSLEVDTGPFFTLVKQGDLVETAGARLNESRDKSVWQNTGEVGVRFRFNNGLTLEAGYSLTGYLDTVLLPSLIIVPENFNQAGTGTTALYNSQDYVVEGWHAGLAFQF